MQIRLKPCLNMLEKAVPHGQSHSHRLRYFGAVTRIDLGYEEWLNREFKLHVYDKRLIQVENFSK